MRWRRTLIALAVVPLVGAAFFVQFKRSAGPRVEVALADIPVQASPLVAAPGFVEPVSEIITISASAPGRLVSMNVDEGDKVSAGEIIAEIENGDLRAKLAAADADLRVRQSALARLEAGARDQEKAEAEAALREAEANAALASRQFARQSSLAGTTVPKAAVDQAHGDLDAADARQTLLAEKLSLIEAPPRPEDVQIAEAQVDAAKAQIAEAQALIDKTIIRSPINGVVLRRYAKAGEMMAVQLPTVIAELGDVSRLRVRAQVDEADVARVKVGEDVLVTADAYGPRHFEGRVTKIGEIMGQKDFRTDEPGERMDTKVLDVLIDLQPGVQMPVGLRVDVMFQGTSEVETGAVDPRTILAEADGLIQNGWHALHERSGSSRCGFRSGMWICEKSG